MILHIIKLQNTFSSSKLNKHISNFFNLNFNSEYIKVQLKLKDTNNKFFKLGGTHIINLKQVRAIKSYKSLMLDEYKQLQPNNARISQIIFEYIEIDKFEMMKNYTK